MSDRPSVLGWTATAKACVRLAEHRPHIWGPNYEHLCKGHPEAAAPDGALGRCQVLIQCHHETGHEGGHEGREEVEA
jgi:hypothetical protein